MAVDIAEASEAVFDDAGEPPSNELEEQNETSPCISPTKIAIVTLPDALGSRPERRHLRSCATSFGLHVLALLTLYMSSNSHWQPLPMPSGTTTIQLTAVLADEIPAPDQPVHIDVPRPTEIVAQPVSVKRVETEVAQQPREVEAVAAESVLVEPAVVPRAESQPAARDSQLPQTHETVPRSAKVEVLTMSPRSVTVPVVSRSAAAANTPPRVVYNPPPAYPAAQLAAGISGRVVLLATINSRGRVVSLAVEQSSGSAALDRAARDAVSQWRFEPSGTIHVGESEVRIPISFRIARGG